MVELRPNIHLIKSEKAGSHVYLVKGNSKNVLIDTGMTANFPYLKASLQKLNLRPKDIHLIILTHEPADHIRATGYFFDTAVVAAHRLAANKIELQDEFVTLMKYCNVSCRPFHALHTPGHTSGCICLYETKENLLFTGDTVFSGGTLSGIAASGNISDYMNSLQRLSSPKLEGLYPGHGKPSEDPEGDMLRGLERARALLDDTKILFDTLARKWGKQVMVERTLRRLSPGKGN